MKNKNDSRAGNAAAEKNTYRTARGTRTTTTQRTYTDARREMDNMVIDFMIRNITK